jgi:hypothetical protein
MAGPLADARSDAFGGEAGPQLDAPFETDASPPDADSSAVGEVDGSPGGDAEASPIGETGSVDVFVDSSFFDSPPDVAEGGSNGCIDGDQRCSGEVVQSCLGGQWSSSFSCDAGSCNGLGSVGFA